MIIKEFVLGAIQTNCYVVSCPETREAAIIDPGDYSPSLEHYIQEQQLLVKYIINTHSHFDHAGGNKKVKEFTGARLLIHQAEADVLPQISTFASMFGLQLEDSPPADAFIAEGDEISFGEVTLNVLETPGHSPGGVTLYADKVACLEEALSDPAIKTEAAEIMRGLIDRIELRPRENGPGLQACLHGDLAQILAFCDGTKGKKNESLLKRFLAKPGVQVLYATEATTRSYASLYRQLRTQGTPIPTNDLWIAALVVENDLSLYTRDDHFESLPQLNLF